LWSDRRRGAQQEVSELVYMTKHTWWGASTGGDFALKTNMDKIALNVEALIYRIKKKD